MYNINFDMRIIGGELNKSIYITVLILAIFVGGVLRFYNLTNQKMLLYDEGWYMLETKFWHSLIERADLIVPKMIDGSLNSGFLLNVLEGQADKSKKPMHNLSVAIFSFFTGLKDYTGNLYSAIYGVLTVVLIFIMGSIFFGRLAGVFSAVFMAVSQYNIFYSRLAYAEADSVFFFLLGLTFYLLGTKDRKNKFILLSGISFALAVTCNYRWIWMLPLFILYESYLFLAKEKAFFNLIKRFSFLYLPTLILMFLFELPWRILMVFDSLPQANVSSTGKLMTYFQGIFKGHTDKFVSAFNPGLRYLDMFFRTEGAFVTVLFILGLILILVRRIRFKSLILGFIFVPLVFFSLLMRGNVPHAIGVPMGLYPLVCGFCVSEIFNYVRLRGSIVNVLMLIVVSFSLLIGFRNSKNVLVLKSGYREAAQFLEGKEEMFFTTIPSILDFYMGSDSLYKPARQISNYLPPRFFDELLKESRRTNRRYLVVDYFKYMFDYDSVKELERQCEPVFISNNFIQDKFFLLVQFSFYRQELIEKLYEDSSINEIRVYDLNRCKLNQSS